MFTISRKTQYGLRAVFALTKVYAKGPVSSVKIAENESIPHHFLVQILTLLQKGGVVESWPGRGGGYALARRPEQITVGEVVELIDGPVEGLAGGGTGEVLGEVWAAVDRVLDGTTLRDVCEREDAARGEGLGWSNWEI